MYKEKLFPARNVIKPSQKSKRPLFNNFQEKPRERLSDRILKFQNESNQQNKPLNLNINTSRDFLKERSVVQDLSCTRGNHEINVRLIHENVIDKGH